MVTTYWSGIVDENDLCFLGGFPGPLRRLTGIWSEEIDALYDGECNFAVPAEGNPSSLKGEYRAVEMLDLIHAETAQVLASYKTDFYQGRPALTENSFGKGKAYYIAFRSGLDFLTDFYTRLVHDLGIAKVIDTDLPEGVTAQKRSDGETDYVFLMNFSDTEKTVDLNKDVFRDMLDGTRVEGRLQLSGYGVRVLERKQG